MMSRIRLDRARSYTAMTAVTRITNTTTTMEWRTRSLREGQVTFFSSAMVSRNFWIRLNFAFLPLSFFLTAFLSSFLLTFFSDLGFFHFLA